MTNIIRDLGGGLHLKAGTIEDLDRLSDYNARYLSDEGPDNPEEVLRHWTSDLMTKHHTAGPGDFTYVEDINTGEVISSICLISQTWEYEGIPFGVGRVEMVSTHKDYRRKGLIRAQFEVLHEWSKAKGEKMGAVTGIPYFYRQFGYEMTIHLGGRRRGYRPHVPKLKEDEAEPYKIRLATPKDIPFMNQMYDRGRKRSLISCPRNEEIWQYEMKEQHETFRSDMTIVETLEGEPVGFVWHNNKIHGSSLALFCYELKKGVSYSSVTPSVIRYLKSKGEEFANKDEEKEWEAFTFHLGSEHPAYDVTLESLPDYDPPYAWYIRIPDLLDFLQHISPVLETRLKNSDQAGYRGELLLDFHRSGIKLSMDQGSITRIEKWQPTTEDRGHVAFPDLVFLQLVTGYRSFDELRNFFPDCYTRKKPEAAALIKVLFPKKNSYILGIV